VIGLTSAAGRTSDASRLSRNGLVSVGIVTLLVVVASLSLTHGAAAISPSRVWEILVRLVTMQHTESAPDALIVVNIRLPRLILGLVIGASLGMSGALMQGLFGNPLADPGLVGVSSGAGAAAAAAIVLGDRFTIGGTGVSSFSVLPIAAFLGALAMTSTLYFVSTRRGLTSVATMLLAGVALGALASALTGVLAYISDDRQLRDLTFWSMGSLGGATWIKVAVLAPIGVLLLAAGPFLSRGLNALALGEAEAFHLGVRVQGLKFAVVFLVAIAVGASVAAAGAISFVGIVAPHVLRLMVGPDHRALLPLSMAAGATILIGADLFARTLVAPAEMPIGILTAAIGAPFFLWLLMRREGTAIE
jgi:iron complex transport system permease protein